MPATVPGASSATASMFLVIGNCAISPSENCSPVSPTAVAINGVLADEHVFDMH